MNEERMATNVVQDLTEGGRTFGVKCRNADQRRRLFQRVRYLMIASGHELDDCAHPTRIVYGSSRVEFVLRTGNREQTCGLRIEYWYE